MIGLPATQRALVAESAKAPHQIKEIPVPVPADDELLIRIRYSGICHSDMGAYEGDWPAITKFPLIGGHEGAGEVVAIGKNVKDWQVGDNVGVKMRNNVCLSCEFCKKGFESNCPHIVNTGYGSPGTFQEYMTIRAIEAAKIPKGADLASVAPILCAGVTIYRAIKESNVHPGEILALTGAAGGLGSFGIQYAKAMGLKVLAISNKSKEEHCRNLGADYFQDAYADDIVESIRKMTNGGPHGVINLAPAKKAMEDSVLYVRTRGTLVFVGFPKENMPEMNSFYIVYNCLTIKGSLTGNRQDVDDAIAFVTNGAVKVPVELVRLEDVPTAFEKLHKGEIKGRAVVDMALK